jgi:hypothetical protein
MERDFQEKIWTIVKRSKYVLNRFIKELKIRIIFASKNISLPQNLLPLKEANFIKEKWYFRGFRGAKIKYLQFKKHNDFQFGKI